MADDIKKVGVQLDTTKDGLKAIYLLAQRDYPKGSKVDQFRLAVARFVLDAAGVKDKATRAHAVKSFMATMGSFGSNLSGFEQVLKLREASGSEENPFTGEV